MATVSHPNPHPSITIPTGLWLEVWLITFLIRPTFFIATHPSPASVWAPPHGARAGLESPPPPHRQSTAPTTPSRWSDGPIDFSFSTGGFLDLIFKLFFTPIMLDFILPPGSCVGKWEAVRETQPTKSVRVRPKLSSKNSTGEVCLLNYFYSHFRIIFVYLSPRSLRSTLTETAAYTQQKTKSVQLGTIRRMVFSDFQGICEFINLYIQLSQLQIWLFFPSFRPQPLPQVILPPHHIMFLTWLQNWGHSFIFSIFHQSLSTFTI